MVAMTRFRRRKSVAGVRKELIVCHASSIMLCFGEGDNTVFDGGSTMRTER